jgi:hypothetical protein
MNQISFIGEVMSGFCRLRDLRHLATLAAISCLLFCMATGTLSGEVFSGTADLFPVKFHAPPKHPPLSLVRQSKLAAAIYVMHPAMNAKKGANSHPASLSH